MAKQKKELDGLAKFNRVSPVTNAIFSALFIIFALSCVLPLLLVIIISLSSQNSLNLVGYSFFPAEWSASAYVYLWNTKESILGSFLVSIVVTLCGTLLGIALNGTMGYVLSRNSFILKPFFTYVILIPMLFGGGMVASYLVMTQFLYLKNNILALILPLAVSSFNCVIFRTFFQTTIPDEIIESAKMDGASQLRIFVSIVLPVSLPAIATIGLFLSIAYWNDWFNALLYIEDKNLYPLQYLLMKIEQDMNFLKQNAMLMGGVVAEMAKTLPAETTRMAIVVLAVLPIACSYPFFQKYFISGLTIGAVKG